MAALHVLDISGGDNCSRAMGDEMKIKDKSLKVLVDVAQKECQSFTCYWPRPDPGVFTQGQGYRQRECRQGWLCGRREIHGCPVSPVAKVVDP